MSKVLSFDYNFLNFTQILIFGEMSTFLAGMDVVGTSLNLESLSLVASNVDAKYFFGVVKEEVRRSW